ncbi:MAG: hypothetical protein NDI84_06460 [Steroidobacteraceae bacterium]|nr:hypothetical protein [Steroidobacteraceae bacterium]
MRRVGTKTRPRAGDRTARLMRWVPLLVPLVAAAIFVVRDWRREAAAEVIVYRGRSCECCVRRAAHLRERPAVAGIAVPDMPIGSPGMEQGDRHDSYVVLAFDTDGAVRVFERH